MFSHEFHHMGIPTQEIKPNERYSARFKMYTTDSISARYRIQFHRFEDGCPLHPLIQTMPHIAYKVSSIEEAIQGEQVILEPYFPFARFQVAMINKNGVPIEFIETDLREDEIWSVTKHKDSTIYLKCTSQD